MKNLDVDYAGGTCTKNAEKNIDEFKRNLEFLFKKGKVLNAVINQFVVNQKSQTPFTDVCPTTMEKTAKVAKALRKIEDTIQTYKYLKKTSQEGLIDKLSDAEILEQISRITKTPQKQGESPTEILQTQNTILNKIEAGEQKELILQCGMFLQARDDLTEELTYWNELQSMLNPKTTVPIPIQYEQNI